MMHRALRVALILSAATIIATAATSRSQAQNVDGASRFPVAVDSSKRFLRDASGQPFLIQGEAAWSLIANLKREDVDLYLRDRRDRGFNTLIVSLIEHHFSNSPPNNAYGAAPFLRSGDFTRPNEAYFAHADWVLRRAQSLGFLVLLTPAYMGIRGGDEGWYQEMAACGADCLKAYGRYLGQRYRSLHNIVWMHAGDYDPPDKELVRALADGVRETDPEALHTVHCGPETKTLELWGDEPWLSINTVYTYEPVLPAVAAELKRPQRMPFILAESAYEHEHDAGGLRIRTQAYQALLTGAAGQVFGNKPIWYFGRQGLSGLYESWKHALGSPGSRSIAHLNRLFSGLPWWTFVPDVNGELVVRGGGSGQEHTATARTDDRALAVVYLPGQREITVDLAQLQGPQVRARWLDPADGQFADASQRVFTSLGLESLRPPGANSGGEGDWVLLLTSEASQSAGRAAFQALTRDGSREISQFRVRSPLGARGERPIVAISASDPERPDHRSAHGTPKGSRR
jgi:hypothetical protein